MEWFVIDNALCQVPCPSPNKCFDSSRYRFRYLCLPEWADPNDISTWAHFKETPPPATFNIELLILLVLIIFSINSIINTILIGSF
jgi:hypothetical protein